MDQQQSAGGPAEEAHQLLAQRPSIGLTILTGANFTILIPPNYLKA